MKNTSFVTLIFMTLAYLPCHGQAIGGNGSSNLPDKNHLLWWKGHWSPTKKNMFVIDKDSLSGGGTATVNSDGSVQVQGGGQDDWNKKIDAGVKQIDNWVQQLSDPANNTDPQTYALSQLLLPDAQERQQQWNGYKIDKGQDVLSPDTKPGQQPAGNTGNNSGTGQGGAPNQAAPQRTLLDVLNNLCTQGKADYDAVLSYYNAHKKYNDADLPVPVPPEFEYDCYACDSNQRISSDAKIREYVENFPHPDDTYIRKGLALMRELALLGLEGGTVDAELADAFSKKGACHDFSYSQLADAVRGIATHLHWRGEKLLNKYHKDFKALAAIARTYLSTTRNYILLTGDDKADADFSTLSSMAGQAFEYYIGKLKHNDWRQIGNLTFIISLARDVALLGGSGDDLYVGYMSRIKNILDGFTLSVEMDVKFGKGQGYWISHLKGDCKIGPDFERDSNQCYKWIILDENRPDLFGFYRPKLVQEFDCQLITNQITAPMPPVYIGTKKYSITLHGLKMDFCNPGKDTIILSNFYPNPTNAGTWRIPQAGLAYWGVEGDHFFEDTKAKQKLAESGQAQAEMAKYQSQNEQMIAQMKAMAQHMANDTGRKSAADYQQIMQMFNKVRESSNNGVMAKMLSLDFEIPVENNGQVLVDKMFDAREINPQFAAAIVYARYTIHIENKANPQQKPPVNIPAK